MNKIFVIILLLVSIASCASASKEGQKNEANENTEELLDLAEEKSSGSARKILETSRSMIASQEVHIGGCWNYVNAVYDRAGYVLNQRETVYKSKFQGPYVDPKIIQSGDWLYFVNHSYRDIEHSAIFVAWINEAQKDALMISYVGGNKSKPATYKRFILDNVYNVIRVPEY